VTFALMSAISLLPPGLILVWTSAAGFVSRSVNLDDLRRGETQSNLVLSQLPVMFGAELISGLFGVLWTTAIIATTEAYLRGEQPRIARVYGLAVRRFFVVLLAGLLVILGAAVLSVVSFVLLVVTLIGVLGTIIAIVGLLFWWLRPGTRKGWLKWLIILVTPFGLLTYFTIRWSMFAIAATLEGYGPLGSLRRSAELVDRQWFRAASILVVGGLIVGTIVSAPAALIQIPFTISELARGQVGLSPTETAISYAASLVLQIVFASIGTIIYTFLFFDLRNRREGTDMVERLTQLEASPLAANG
jgi:hypothetical protein